MTIQSIIESVTEQDAYRRDAEIKRRIYDWAVSKLPVLQEGYHRKITSVGYETGEAQYVDVAESVIAEQAAQAKLALLTPELMTSAHVYRVALQRNFGVGAETDQAITEKFVESYFAGKAAAGVITAQEIADGELLKMTFPAIAEWTGDGTAWSFPWGVLP